MASEVTGCRVYEEDLTPLDGLKFKALELTFESQTPEIGQLTLFLIDFQI